MLVREQSRSQELWWFPGSQALFSKFYQLAGLRARIWEALERQTAEGQHELRSWVSLRLAKQAVKRMARCRCKGSAGKGEFLSCSNPRTMLESSSRTSARNAIFLMNWRAGHFWQVLLTTTPSFLASTNASTLMCYSYVFCPEEFCKPLSD